MPNEQKYYFLSTFYTGDLLKWIRNQFMTKEQVINWIKEMDPKQYGRIEIFDEETLKLEFYLKDENDDFFKCNLREYLFGSIYSTTSDSYERMKKNSLKFKD